MPASRLSITYWDRLEPRPRSPHIEEALAARVRDPAWFLARQWQLGEFRGEDAGSIAHVELQPQVVPIEAWRAAEGQPPISLAGPLEPAALSEQQRVDAATRAE